MYPGFRLSRFDDERQQSLCGGKSLYRLRPLRQICPTSPFQRRENDGKQLSSLRRRRAGNGFGFQAHRFCAMEKGKRIRTAETIGMAQRGGCVVSHVRIGDEIFSPMIPLKGADILIAFEPAEAVRCPSLSERRGHGSGQSESGASRYRFVS